MVLNASEISPKKLENSRESLEHSLNSLFTCSYSLKTLKWTCIDRCVFDDNANEYLKKVTPLKRVFLLRPSSPTRDFPGLLRNLANQRNDYARAQPKDLLRVRCGLKSFVRSSLKGTLLYFKTDKKSIGNIWRCSLKSESEHNRRFPHSITCNAVATD